MQVETNIISSDPVKYAAEAKAGTFSYRYIGEIGESRGVVKRKAIKGLEERIEKHYYPHGRNK